MKAPQVTEPLYRELSQELRSKIRVDELWKEQEKENYKDVMKLCRDKNNIDKYLKALNKIEKVL